MAVRHGRSINAYGPSILYAMSAQNPLNQVERLHPKCYNGCHIWLGQHHQHSLCASIGIIRPRGQILSWCSSVYLLRFRRWIFSRPFLEPGGAQVDDLEPPGLITSLLTLACLWPIDFLWHKIVRSGGQSLRPQRLWVFDWLIRTQKRLTQSDEIWYDNTCSVFLGRLLHPRSKGVGPNVSHCFWDLYYCNCLLVGITDGLMRRLQAVQNAAASLITGTRRRDHIIPILRQLHWLSVRQRIELKLAMLVFKTLHGSAPQSEFILGM